MYSCINCAKLEAQLREYQNYAWPNGHTADAKESVVQLWNELERVVDRHGHLLTEHQKLININTLLHEQLAK